MLIDHSAASKSGSQTCNRPSRPPEKSRFASGLIAIEIARPSCAIQLSDGPEVRETCPRDARSGYNWIAPPRLTVASHSDPGANANASIPSSC